MGKKKTNIHFSIPMHYTQSTWEKTHKKSFLERWAKIAKNSLESLDIKAVYAIDYVKHEQQQLYRIKYVLTY